MLTTIQELEQEIEQFHKNIKDSNELMNVLISVVSITKLQKEDFDIRTKSLQDEIANLSPELSIVFQEKISECIKMIYDEHQTYQTTVKNLVEKYYNEFMAAEDTITKIPGIVETQAEDLQKHYMEELDRAEVSYFQILTSSLEKFVSKISQTTENLSKVPNVLKEKLQEDYVEHLVGLKKIQEQYTLDLGKINKTFEEQIQDTIESIKTIQVDIKENSNQQYSEFLNEFEKIVDARIKQLYDTEKKVENLSKHLEVRYNDFVTKLEATNVDQLYKYCQAMNKSINIKLMISIIGVALVVILSIISFFI